MLLKKYKIHKRLINFKRDRVGIRGYCMTCMYFGSTKCILILHRDITRFCGNELANYIKRGGVYAYLPYNTI